MERTGDRISLVGLRGFGRHGVLADERRDGQQFVADVVLYLDTRAAAAADDLARTVDYSVVAQQVYDILTGEPVDLLETVAQRIADICLAGDLVQAVEVAVHKPNAPVAVPFDDLTVRILRERS